jgi:tagatose-1,6-bisphosphate aldolase non-catalytic subunit AgaZ/GatZ
MRPAKSEQHPDGSRELLVGAERSHTRMVCTRRREKYVIGTRAPRPGAITNTMAEAVRITHRYEWHSDKPQGES